ncbi:hypothetical protein ACFXAE_29935 [Streptomyces sp. NPDC059454]|uniref:hypothetical protein n=1 Tax=Streptomyces sp. NPDC059454 TaxID=3346836 RepID=UPI0036BF34DC
MERVGPRTDLRALARGGVLLTAWALDAGWPQSSLALRLRADGWTRVRNGAWIEPGKVIDAGVRMRVTQLLTPRLVVSHRSAARLWQIETLGTGSAERVEFTDPGLSFRGRLTDVRVHRLPLAETDVARRCGLRVTDVPRTLADLLRNGGRDDALVAVESALGYRRVGGVRRPPLVAPAALSLALEAPLLGSARARDRLGLVDRDSGSPAETIARLRMLDAGLRPETQVEVRTPSGRRRYLDFLFRAEGLAVEIEGYAYHGTREAHRRDMARFNEIARCPEVRHVLRFGAAEVFEGAGAMIDEIRASLVWLRARGGGPPVAST